MRTLAIRLLGVGAWLSLATALPGIWLAGFCRGWAVALDVPDVTDPPIRRYPTAVLTESDVSTLLGTHENAMRRGEAKWQ